MKDNYVGSEKPKNQKDKEIGTKGPSERSGPRKWDKEVAGGHENFYASGNKGRARVPSNDPGEEVGATGQAHKSPTPAPGHACYGNHGPE